MNLDKNRVASKVWLITGCSTGFGRALAEAVLKQGDFLLATARKPEQLHALIKHYPETAKAIRLDVTASQDIQAAVDAAIATFGRIDVLVNNAGHGLIAALEEVSDDQIHQFFETNFFGALRLMRAVLPVMRQQGSGHIVNLSSTAGFVGFGGSSLYCGAKFALEGTSEALAREVESFGIRVTLIEPGAFRTDFNGRSLAAAEHSIDAYAGVSGASLQWFKKMDGQQTGNPTKAAQAIIQAVESPRPPMRLALGIDAMKLIQEKLEQVKTDLEAWQGVTVSTDYTDSSSEVIIGVAKL
ncbi:oxidoreductase [Leptolyngbya sp. NIES-2104]|uniref:oxidoreductase n=1 Tax=Leptolyngbya sp. NIES-2104 TaxID=1552121 RepID=UPI0006EC64BB|nr:oxidoreductase [Leptolyngbya sp. NIES-2104]GAP99474.1 3-oxoacyl-[acyl-carrier protein] reductase [Leptolyngbya sp. NIES-2104]